MLRLLLVNGPNLNLLGTREPGIYGSQTLADAVSLASATGATLGVEVLDVQSNHEGVLIDAIQGAPSAGVSGVVINGGGLSHTSVALADALAGVALPWVEVHVSNVFARESFRHHSYLSAGAVAVISGCGIAGYGFAVETLVARLVMGVDADGCGG
jgi:3-dehydroquinate dehydratase-2